VSPDNGGLPRLEAADLGSAPWRVPKPSLGSRAYDKGRFSVRFEEGVYHFQILKHAYRARRSR
jgi:hypothetical protein